MEKLTCPGTGKVGGLCGLNTVDHPEDVEVIDGIVHCHQCDKDTSIEDACEWTKRYSGGSERAHYLTEV